VSLPEAWRQEVSSTPKLHQSATECGEELHVARPPCIALGPRADKACPFRKFYPALDSRCEVESSHRLNDARDPADLRMLVDVFKSRMRLEAENLFLRHQLNIALRRAPPRLQLRGSDRALMVSLVRLWSNLLGVAQVVKPETIS
jgi:hypothetical protein